MRGQRQIVQVVGFPEHTLASFCPAVVLGVAVAPQSHWVHKPAAAKQTELWRREARCFVAGGSAGLSDKVRRGRCRDGGCGDIYRLWHSVLHVSAELHRLPLLPRQAAVEDAQHNNMTCIRRSESVRNPCFEDEL